MEVIAKFCAGRSQNHLFCCWCNLFSFHFVSIGIWWTLMQLKVDVKEQIEEVFLVWMYVCVSDTSFGHSIYQLMVQK